MTRAEKALQAKLIKEIKKRHGRDIMIYGPALNDVSFSPVRQKALRFGATKSEAYELEQYLKNQVTTAKGEGLVRGQNDLNIDRPSGSYHGLRLELKTLKEGFWYKYDRKRVRSPKWLEGRYTEQAVWLSRCNKEGYFGTFAQGFDQAIAIVDAYLERGTVPGEFYEIDLPTRYVPLVIPIFKPNL